MNPVILSKPVHNHLRFGRLHSSNHKSRLGIHHLADLEELLQNFHESFVGLSLTLDAQVVRVLQEMLVGSSHVENHRDDSHWVETCSGHEDVFQRQIDLLASDSLVSDFEDFGSIGNDEKLLVDSLSVLEEFDQRAFVMVGNVHPFGLLQLSREKLGGPGHGRSRDDLQGLLEVGLEDLVVKSLIQVLKIVETSGLPNHVGSH
jgi:hypothetical protein